MLRWLGILIALALASPRADAQVFKPKSKKAGEKKAAADKSAKKPRTAPAKQRAATKKKKPAGERTRADDAPKGSDKDYVKIWDDDEIE